MKRKLVSIAVGILPILSVLPYLIPLPSQPDLDPQTLAHPDGRFVAADGTTTFVRTAGHPAAPAVVLVHGFGGSTFSWRHTLPALADAGFYAVALDLKGFGLSTKTYDADYSHPAQADFIAAVMDELGVETATLVGHSMGGSVAGHFALRHPQRTDKLVIVDGAFFGGETRLNAGWLFNIPPIRRTAQIIMRATLTPEAVTGRLRTAYHNPNFVTPAVAEGYLAPQQVADWDLALMGIVRDANRNALPRPTSSIGAPTLIVWGEHDSWVPLAAGESLKQQLPAAQWATFSNSGHLPMEEEAEAFNKRLIEFLSGR